MRCLMVYGIQQNFSKKAHKMRLQAGRREEKEAGR